MIFRLLLIGAIGLVLFKSILVSDNKDRIFAAPAPQEIPDYYQPVQQQPSVVSPVPSPAPIQGTVREKAWHYARTDEAKRLIASMSDETFDDLKPDVVAIVDKLISEGNDLEWSKNGAGVLIAFFTPECTGLPKEAQKDFGRALVEASVTDPVL